MLAWTAGDRRSSRDHRRKSSGDYSKRVDRQREKSVDASAPILKARRDPWIHGSITSDELKTTFENLKTVISSDEEAYFEKESVVGMLESIYWWMVSDKNLQITVPSAPGSRNVRKMWPHGSTIDTRKREDLHRRKSDPRYLKELTDDEASTVASSVVSSAPDDECSVPRHNRVVYQSMHSQNSAYGHGAYGASEPQPLFSDVQPQSYGYQTQYQYQPTPQRSHQISAAFRPQPAKPTARYSMVAGGVEAPVPVPETPLSSHAQVQPKSMRKTRVGAAKRREGGENNGDEVIFAD